MSKITNKFLAQMATLTIKGNNTGGTANPSDLTVAQVKTMLNLAGTNSGDVTLAAVDSTPNANGASLSGQVLTLQPADATNPGVLTALAQTFGGVKTMLNDVHTGYSDYSTIATPSTPGAGISRLYSFTGIGGAIQLAKLAPAGDQVILAQDTVIEAINGSGSTITRGKAVLILGQSAGVPNAVLAQANTLAGSLVLGLVQTSSAVNGAAISIISNGILINVDTSAFSAGDTIYLSTVTPGALTNTAPVFPALITKIGTVLTSSATVGTIVLAIVNAVPVPVATTNVPFYFSATASSDISGYDQLITAPNTGTETIFTGTGVQNVKTLIKSFATEVGTPMVTLLPTGTWAPQIYASVNNSGGTNTLTCDVYKRASGGTETLLYSVVTPNLTTLATQYDLSSAQGPFTLVSTDRLVFKISYTTNTSNHITSFYTQGSLHNSVVISTLTAAIGVELQANKNTANGYAGLDGSTKLFLSQFPAGTALTPKVEQITLISGDITNQYIDLAFVAQGSTATDNSILLFVIKGSIQEKGVSYTVSLTGGSGGVTRITFAGDLAIGGDAALVTGNTLVISYSH